eukprot:7760387-Pyramimonas_sp.AAC.1
MQTARKGLIITFVGKGLTKGLHAAPQVRGDAERVQLCGPGGVRAAGQDGRHRCHSKGGQHDQQVPGHTGHGHPQ